MSRAEMWADRSCAPSKAAPKAPGQNENVVAKVLSNLDEQGLGALDGHHAGDTLELAHHAFELRKVRA